MGGDFAKFVGDTEREYNEYLLGYQLELMLLDKPVALDKVRLEKVESTKKTGDENSRLLQKIVDYRWEQAQKKFNAFDNPRMRYEGCFTDGDGLLVKWSEDSYKNHVGTRDAMVGKGYLPNLWTINVVPITADGKIPVTRKNEANSDQCKAVSTTPLGFWNIGESVVETFDRVYDAEWDFPGAKPDPLDAYFVGITYNSRRNNDVCANIVSRLSYNHDQVKSKQLTSTNPKGKFDKITWVDVTKEGIENLFYDLTENYSDVLTGHYAADVALTYGFLHGGRSTYESLLNNALTRISNKRFEKEIEAKKA